MHSQTLFENSVRKSEAWVDDLAELLGSYDSKATLRAMRILLHAWRDRLPLNESAQFAAQMPPLIRGIYYENWRPAVTPDKSLDRESLLLELTQTFPSAEPEAMCRAFGRLLAKHISKGEIDDILSSLPKSLRELWGEPETVAPA